jgi:AcrR family transcriptional regulator
MICGDAAMQIQGDKQENSAAAKRGRRAAGQDPAKRAQILDGAKRCFLSVGFEAASMNDITSESGVSKGTLYVYFEDKEDLFAALIDREKSAVMSAAQHQLELPGTIPEALHRFGAYVTARLTSDEVIRAQRMVLGVAERMPEIAQRFFTGDSFSAHHLLQAWLDQRVAAGELAIADTDLAARQFLELSMASIYKRRLFGNLAKPVPQPEIERVVSAAVDLFMTYYGKK